MGSGGTLVVATWGAPFKWEEVGYLVEVLPSSEGCKLSKAYYGREVMDSRSTLEPVMRSYGSGHALVYVLDTLAYHREFPSKIGNARLSYGSLRSILVETIKGYLPRLGTVELEVAPGVGYYEKQDENLVGEFRYSPMNFESYMIATLYSRLSRLKPLEVILDISHGVNYMPTMALRAVRSSIYAYLLYGAPADRIRLLVLNSEPVIKGYKGPYRVHITDCSILTREEAIEATRSALMKIKSSSEKPIKMAVREMPSEQASRLRDEIEQVMEYASRLMDSIVYGMPLLLAYKILDNGAEPVKPEAIAEDAAKLLGSRDVTCNGRICSYSQPHILLPESLAAALQASALLSALRREKIKSREIHGLKFVHIESLEGLVSRYMSPYKSAYTIANHELSNIKKAAHTLADIHGALRVDREKIIVPLTALEKLREGLPINLGELHSILAGLEPSSKELRLRKDQLDKRVLYAHAGLQKEAVLILLEHKGEATDVLVAFKEGALEQVEKSLGP